VRLALACLRFTFFLLITGCALLFCRPTVAAYPQTSVDSARAVSGIDADVDLAMQELHVPGVAVGVILDGKVILAKGYGVREVGKPALVDGQTLFDIGSMSKSFTAAAVAAMVDDGKLDWDTPVINYIPWFRMYDPVATQLITPRDLLVHRSGLPRHDFIRESTYLTREELIRRIRYLEPSHSFREVFQYNNLMYVVAGYLAGQVDGTTWENLVKHRLFIPLEMTHSNTSATELQNSDDFAQPHDQVDGKIVKVPVYDYQKFGVGPNGAVNSCVDDMLKYLAFYLAEGKVENHQVISATQMKELLTPVVVSTPSNSSLLAKDREDYALGWATFYYHGRRIFQHSGAITGFTSYMILIPSENIGIVVLNNLGGSPLPGDIAADLVDRLLGAQRRNYVQMSLAFDAESERQSGASKASFAASRIPNTKPTLPLSAYTGTYTHPAYGDIHVEVEGEGLTVRFDALSLSLQHYHYDTFSFDTSLVQFHIGESGRVVEMLLPLEPAVKPFVFTRREK
jgi:CubicO group peptidase (beta-lactamase class C family)